MPVDTLETLTELIAKAGFDAFAIMPAVPVDKMEPILELARAEGRYPPFVDRDLKKE